MTFLMDSAKHWNATLEERMAVYPCDAYMEGIPFQGWIRAVDVGAPPRTVFRWLCQLKVAPYSYDWVDNGGRASPKSLVEGVDQLEKGQRFLVFEIVDFETDRHITGRVTEEFRRVYGPLAVSYMVRPVDLGRTRLVARLDVGAVDLKGRIRRFVMVWGDLMMARKQLLTLKRLAERDALELQASSIGK